MNAPVPPTDEPSAAGGAGARDGAHESGWLRRNTRRLAWSGGAVGVLVAIVIASLVIRVPYYQIMPGQLRPIEPHLHIDGEQTYPTGGAVAYATAGQREATAFSALWAWTHPDIELIHRDDLFGDRDPDEDREFSMQLMDSSKDVAIYVALGELGYEVEARGSGAFVSAVVEGTPAHGVIEPGETIVAVDGAPVEVDEDLVSAMGELRPGEEVTIALESLDGDGRTVEVVLAERPEDSGGDSGEDAGAGAGGDDGGRGFLGVEFFTRDAEFDYPFEIDIDSGEVGGNSAGLAFALAIIDALTPDTLTGEEHVAVTGALSRGGAVHSVGAVHQKTVAAESDGYAVFLVPDDGYEVARAAASDMEVIGVESLGDALAALERLGGNTDQIEELAAARGGAAR